MAATSGIQMFTADKRLLLSPLYVLFRLLVPGALLLSSKMQISSAFGEKWLFKARPRQLICWDLVITSISQITWTLSGEFQKTISCAQLPPHFYIHSEEKQEIVVRLEGHHYASCDNSLLSLPLCTSSHWILSELIHVPCVKITCSQIHVLSQSSFVPI